MKKVRAAKRNAMLLGVGLLVIQLVGCTTEYHGYNSGIDGALWRQIAAFEDPLSRSLFSPQTDDPASYLAALEGARWDGSMSTAADIDVTSGGVVL
jgi:hypothetical protein